LPDYIGESNGFSGCTILGDGTVSLIIDVGAVSQMTGTYHASSVDKIADWDEGDKPVADSMPSDFSFADLEAVAGTTV
jgi:chemotaxis protein histidine kinase CheA